MIKKNRVIAICYIIYVVKKHMSSVIKNNTILKYIMIQHLSQSASKRRNLKTKETIRSGKSLRRDQFPLNFKIKAVEDFLNEKQNFPNVKTQSFLDNNL